MNTHDHWSFFSRVHPRWETCCSSCAFCTFSCEKCAGTATHFGAEKQSREKGSLIMGVHLLGPNVPVLTWQSLCPQAERRASHGWVDAVFGATHQMCKMCFIAHECTQIFLNELLIKEYIEWTKCPFKFLFCTVGISRFHWLTTIDNYYCLKKSNVNLLSNLWT